jgi:hypothetical protein
MASTGEGPPPGSGPEEPIVSGQQQGRSAFKSNLDSMLESIRVIGRLEGAFSSFTSKMSGDWKRKASDYTKEIENLNKELEHTRDLLEEIQGLGGPEVEAGSTGKLPGYLDTLGSGSTYTQRQLPRTPQGVRDVVERPDDRSAAQPPEIIPPPGGGIGISGPQAGAAAVGALGIAGASWFGRQQEPVELTDSYTRRMAMAAGRPFGDVSSDFDSAIRSDAFATREELFTTGMTLEQRGIVFGGGSYDELLESSAAMRNVMPQFSSEQIAGASASLRHGPAARNLRLRGVTEFGDSPDEIFKGILSFVSGAGKELPPVEVLQSAHPGTPIYQALLNLSGGDPQIVSMILAWGLAEHASREATGRPLQPDLESATSIGLGEETVEQSRRDRESGIEGRLLDRQDDLAGSYQRVYEQTERVADGFHSLTRQLDELVNILPGVNHGLSGIAGTGGQVMGAWQSFNQSLGGIPNILAGVKGMQWLGLLGKGGGVGGGAPGPAPTPVTPPPAAGPAAAGAGPAAGSGALSGMGKLLGPIGVALGARQGARWMREDLARVRGNEEDLLEMGWSEEDVRQYREQIELSYWDRFRGLFGSGPGRSLADILFESVDSLVDREAPEPAGGIGSTEVPVGSQIHGADHDGPGYSSRGFGGVRPHVARAGHYILKNFGPMPGGIGGVGPRSGPSDHPKGLALDFMTLRNTRLGDRVADFFVKNARHFSVSYVIWKQRINTGSGWKKMEDRGSPTANHYDHPHVSFHATPTQGSGGWSSEGATERDEPESAREGFGRLEDSDQEGGTSFVSSSPGSSSFTIEEHEALASFLGGGGVSGGPDGAPVSVFDEATPDEGELGGEDSQWGGPANPAKPGSGALSDSQLVGVLRAAGFSGKGLVTAFAVARAESGGNPRTHFNNPRTGDNSYGLFQINMLGSMGPDRRRQYGLGSNEDLFDPVLNARIAHEMSRGGTHWRDWSVHPASRARGAKGTGYERYLEAAHAAARGGSQDTPPRGGLEMLGQLGAGLASPQRVTGGVAMMGTPSPPYGARPSGRRSLGNVNISIKVEKASRREAERMAEQIMEIIDKRTKTEEALIS